MKNKIWKYIEKNKLTLLFIFVIFTISLFFSAFSYKCTDYYWHIKAGEYMVKNGVVLVKDIFSWSLVGAEWISHEWAQEVFLYLLSVVFPNMHVFIYIFIFAVFILGFSFFSNKRNYLKNIPFSLLWIALFFGTLNFSSARPHWISFSLILVTIYLLRDLFYNGDSKKIYILPLIAVLWANFHGGSSNLVYILILIFIFCGSFKFRFPKIESSKLSKLQIKKYIIVAVLSILCLCINPHGMKMLSYPYINMADSFMMSFISEWYPTDLSNIYHYCYLVPTCVIILIMLFSKQRIKWLDLILLAISIFLGLKSIRFWPYTYIISSSFIFDYISERKYDKGTSMVLVIVALSFLGMFVIKVNSKVVDKKIVPDKIMSVLKDEKIERIYNYYDYGGYLIYNGVKVFVDGRFDLYSKNNMRDYYDIFHLNEGYLELLNNYEFDYFLIPEDSRLARYLKENSNFEKCVSAEDIVLYKLK